MKPYKRFLCCLVSAVLGMAFPSLAWDGETPETASVFCQGSTVYSFFDMKSDNVDGVFVKRVGSTPGNQALRQLSGTKRQVHYFLLVDDSGSMKKNRQQIRAFAERILDTSRSGAPDVTFTLASFGSFFELTEIREEADAQRVLEGINKLTFQEEYSELYKGISEALDYLERRDRAGRARGELVNLIVITDGEPDPASEAPTEEEIREKIAAAKDVVVHMAGMSRAPGLCRYEYEIDADARSPEEAAEEITAFVGRLAVADFTVEQAPEAGSVLADMEVYFNFTEKSRQMAAPPHVMLSDVKVLGTPLEALDKKTEEAEQNRGAQAAGQSAGSGAEGETAGGRPAGNGAEGETAAGQPDGNGADGQAAGGQPAGNGAEGEAAGGRPAGNGAEEETAGGRPAGNGAEGETAAGQPDGNGAEGQAAGGRTDGNGTEGQTESREAEEESSKSKGGFQDLLLPVALVGGILLGIAAAFVLLKKRNPAGSGTKEPEKNRKEGGTGLPVRSSAQGGPAAFMRLSVLSGSFAGHTDEFYLKDELIIGCGSGCDLIWDEPEMEEKNSRIFWKDGMIYIEDLGSRPGTALGGMRLHAPNRLRSGDIISIGSVEFKLLF